MKYRYVIILLVIVFGLQPGLAQPSGWQWQNQWPTGENINDAGSSGK